MYVAKHSPVYLLPVSYTHLDVYKRQHLSLTYRVREPQVTPAIRRAVILLHGVGSNENDLFGLEDQLPDDLYVVAPRGTFVLGSGLSLIHI